MLIKATGSSGSVRCHSWSPTAQEGLAMPGLPPRGGGRELGNTEHRRGRWVRRLSETGAKRAISDWGS